MLSVSSQCKLATYHLPLVSTVQVKTQIDRLPSVTYGDLSRPSLLLALLHHRQTSSSPEVRFAVYSCSLHLSLLSFFKRLGVEAVVAGHPAAEEVPLQRAEVAAELLVRTVESEH